MLKWINVSEELPKIGDRILVCTASKKVYFINERSTIEKGDEITHWMPLPSAPDAEAINKTQGPINAAIILANLFMDNKSITTNKVMENFIVWLKEYAPEENSEEALERSLDEVEKDRHRRGMSDLMVSHMGRFIRKEKHGKN